MSHSCSWPSCSSDCWCGYTRAQDALEPIASANVLLLLGWWLGQTVELALAGLVAGTGLRAAQLRPLVLRVGGGVTLLVVVTIALQSAGLAPAMRIR